MPRKTTKGPKINITGARFGRLKVLAYAGRGSNQQRDSRWRCRCSCGAIVVRSRSVLVSGKTKSCGCLRKELHARRMAEAQRSLIGKQFGRLYVVRLARKTNAGNTRVWCRCACGTLCIKRASVLIGGHSRSCGCLHKELLASRMKKTGKSLLGRRFGRLVVQRRELGHLLAHRNPPPWGAGSARRVPRKPRMNL